MELSSSRLKFLEVKGHFLSFVKEWILKQWGEEEFRKVLRALPPEVARVLWLEALPSSWYPHPYWGEVALTVDRVLGKGDYSLIEAGGRLHAKLQRERIYPRAFEGGLEGFLNNLPVLWKLNFRPGCVWVEPNSAYFLGFHFESEYEPVWVGAKAFFEKVFEDLGAPARVEVLRPGPGERWVVGFRWRFK